MRAPPSPGTRPIATGSRPCAPAIACSRRSPRPGGRAPRAAGVAPSGGSSSTASTTRPWCSRAGGGRPGRGVGGAAPRVGERRGRRPGPGDRLAADGGPAARPGAHHPGRRDDDGRGRDRRPLPAVPALHRARRRARRPAVREGVRRRARPAHPRGGAGDLGGSRARRAALRGPPPSGLVAAHASRLAGAARGRAGDRPPLRRGRRGDRKGDGRRRGGADPRAGSTRPRPTTPRRSSTTRGERRPPSPAWSRDCARRRRSCWRDLRAAHARTRTPRRGRSTARRTPTSG